MFCCGYIFAFSVIWGISLINRTLATYSNYKIPAIHYAQAVVNPLQGLFNFLIYITIRPHRFLSKKHVISKDEINRLLAERNEQAEKERQEKGVA